MIVADISVPNANVYYEIGLTAASSARDAYYLKQKGKPLPADSGNAHYYEYDLRSLDAARRQLADALREWATAPHVKAGQVGATDSAAKRTQPPRRRR